MTNRIKGPADVVAWAIVVVLGAALVCAVLYVLWAILREVWIFGGQLVVVLAGWFALCHVVRWSIYRVMGTPVPFFARWRSPLGLDD